ncbi:hypothetical protein OS493_038228 [Desmophyllum pertusum]|uniref:Uncharacterized protein n=1 Tax=Desmophyllum pertusum TaxID=174260 RepID=A0A9W9ZUZ7_9CNID|nr:hypothetical protein OS493_038228 [Desmophyllum pertusum]
MTAFRVSAQPEAISNSRFPSYVRDSGGTWPGKKAGIQGKHVAAEKKNRNIFIDDDDDDDDLLSGNYTSLPSPLVPLPRAGMDDRNSESSTSEDSPITPRRPAPPPPKRDSSSKNHIRSCTLPGTRSKNLAQGDFSAEVSLSKTKDQQQSDGKDMKQNGKPHTLSSLDGKRDSAFSVKGSPKMRAGPKPLSRPHSVHWKDTNTHGDIHAVEKSPLELRRSNSLEQLSQIKSSTVTSVGSVKTSDQQSVNKGNSTEGTNVPGLLSLQDRIAEAEQNLKKEMKVHTGFKTISQLVMTDPVKQREMEAKVSQSHQKITEWQEELKHLKDEQVFLIESHRKKMLKIKIADLEADLEKQVRSQRSLEMLLGVVEENRKKEVMENIGMCAQLVEKIKTELTELEEKEFTLANDPCKLVCEARFCVNSNPHRVGWSVTTG